MTSNFDIYRSAKVLIDQHGEGAQVEAEKRAENLEANGAAVGAAVWKRILSAVQEMQRTEPPADASQH